MSGRLIAEAGHHWIGVDVSLNMLLEGRSKEASTSGRTLACDVAQGLPFRSGAFDGAVSISALQWLCFQPDAATQLRRFFSALLHCVRPGATSVLQVYVQSRSQLHLILAAARSVGMTAGCWVDAPHAEPAKKTFIIATAPGGSSPEIPPPPESAYGWPVGGGCSLHWWRRIEGAVACAAARGVSAHKLRTDHRLLRVLRHAITQGRQGDIEEDPSGQRRALKVAATVSGELSTCSGVCAASLLLPEGYVPAGGAELESDGLGGEEAHRILRAELGEWVDDVSIDSSHLADVPGWELELLTQHPRLMAGHAQSPASEPEEAAAAEGAAASKRRKRGRKGLRMQDIRLLPVSPDPPDVQEATVQESPSVSLLQAHRSAPHAVVSALCGGGAVAGVVSAVLRADFSVNGLTLTATALSEARSGHDAMSHPRWRLDLIAYPVGAGDVDEHSLITDTSIQRLIMGLRALSSP